MRSRAVDTRPLDPRGRVLLVILLAWLGISCGACSSIRLLADPQRGFEAAGPRTLALGFDRLLVEPIVGSGRAQPTLSAAGVSGDRSAIVYVPLRAYNATDTPWTLSIEDFDVTRIEHRDEELPAQTGDSATQTPIAVVAPGGYAVLSLPLRLPASILDEPRGRYRLRCRVIEDGKATTLLSRDLVLDELRPLRSAAYVIGVGAIILVVGVML